jgi:hypothetical protein
MLHTGPARLVECADMNILLVNAGSSSLKCTLIESADATTIAYGLIDWARSPTRTTPELRSRIAALLPFTPRTVTQKLGSLLESDAVRSPCAEMRDTLSNKAGLIRTAAMIEEFAAKNSG